MHLLIEPLNPSRLGPFEVPMRKQDLLECARKGDFFSYVAGVAYKILTDYQVRLTHPYTRTRFELPYP